MDQIVKRRWLVGVSGRATYLVEVIPFHKHHTGRLDELSLHPVDSHLRLRLGEELTSLESLRPQEQVGSSGNPIVVLDHTPSEILSREDSVEGLQYVIQKLEGDLCRQQRVHQTYKERVRRERGKVRINERRHDDEREEMVQILHAETNARVVMEEQYRSILEGKDRRLVQLSDELADAKKTIRTLDARQACVCWICYSDICDTVTLCGHQFCCSCFRQWALTERGQGADNTSCPHCRRMLVRDQVLAEDQVAFKLHHN